MPSALGVKGLGVSVRFNLEFTSVSELTSEDRGDTEGTPSFPGVQGFSVGMGQVPALYLS